MKLISKLSIAGVLSLTLPVFLATDAIAKGGRNAVTNRTSSATSLDSTETSHLIFMREEEKLARDVYLTFSHSYPNQPVFYNIATKSEQTHTDTMRDKLAQYNIEDPNPDTDDNIGIFTGEEWGEYFNEKFKVLTERGDISELEALYAGAYIEELDMHDIVECPQIMIDAEKYNVPCGLNYTDEPGLINAYNFLLDGSENHLRAYVGQIEAVNGECTYEAQYLSQEDVDAILNRTCSSSSSSKRNRKR